MQSNRNKNKADRQSDDRRLLLRIVQEAYEMPTWNGTNLRASLARVPVEAAVYRPRGGRRCIAEIVVHCAYWKYAIRRQISGEKRGSFALAGSNWFRLPAVLSREQWTEYRELLDEQHRLLCQAIEKSPRNWRYLSPGDQPIVRKIFGLAIHDAYHTGQIHMLKKLWKRSNVTTSSRNNSISST
jgi:hypothetical protein